MPESFTPYSHGLYAETARPSVATPPLDGDARTTVVIIGGGYTGLSTALHLAERGIDALVLEAEQPGFGASGRNGGQVNPGVYNDPDQVLADFGPEAGRLLLEISNGAPDLVFDLVRRHGISCEAQQTGTLRAAYHESRLASVRSLLGQLEKSGSPARWMDAAALAEATGTTRYVGGILYPQGGKLNPLSYARGLAEAAVKAGARVHGGSPATAIARHGAGWRVATPGGAVEAEHVVIATNGYTGALWPGLEQTLVPVWSTIVATEPLQADLAARVMPSGSVLFEVGLNTVYYRLDARNRLLMGGRSVQRPLRNVDDARHLIAYALRLWPDLAPVRWSHAWSGKVAITQDKYIHLHAPAPGLHICLGYNGRGIAMATAMGKALAARIAGDAVPMPLPVSGIKPFPLRRFARIGVTARLIYGRVRDRLGV